MRNFNEEYRDTGLRQYAYDFDSIVRKYMMQSLSPFFTAGKALEIGCFQGDSTTLFSECFEDLTVIEPAESLIAIAKERVPSRVQFVQGTIQSVDFSGEFESIFLVHTLEHLDDPIADLERIKTWLAPSGKLFVVVPNAYAASRQIAVHMSLINTCTSVTEGEREHGHRCTYSLDTLEHDVRSAGLSVVSRGGIVFKPFANFQFDLMIQHKIIDQAYLDGCYALGMKYPDLSASIYLVCGRD